MNAWGYYPPILAYHRVGAFKADHVPTVSAQAFERQLAFLARRHMAVISLETLVQGLGEGCVPRRSTVITFDDGYEQVHRVAWPLLKRFGFPATVFVTPSEVGLPGFATWEQVAEMGSNGVTIGSHTMHHTYLPLVDAQRIATELSESKQAIERRIEQPVRCLSYPVGGYTPEAKEAARQAGYTVACTTNRGLARTRWAIDRFALRRIKITERDAHPMIFGMKVSGYYDLFRSLRQPS